ncbi:hypothetical protein EG345_14565 [Chryseobacterium carnipullorum]|nr:hypothetical protein EG345_14565 [Chryseobacterium carnipullorum]
MKEKFKIMESEINWPLTYVALGLVWLTITIIIAVIVLLFYKLFDHGFNDFSSDRGHFLLFLLPKLSLFPVVCF